MGMPGHGGAGGGNRTPDRLITNQLLYLLSYASRQTGNIYVSQIADKLIKGANGKSY